MPIGLPEGAATGLVWAGAGLDISLGLGVLVRSWARAACLGMAGLSLAYLILGSILTPWLWTDPLGPLFKIVPGAGLALITALMLDER